MTSGLDLRTLLGLVVFLAVIALAISRPRGLNEAWPATGGTVVLLALGMLSAGDVRDVVRETAGILLFLLGMMVLSRVLELAGVFAWAASYAARASGGSGRRLLVNIFILGAVVTALFSLDVTVIVLTPIVYATVVALRVDPLPYLYACTFVANTGSLIFPMSNLTNLLVVDRLGLPFWRYSVMMAVPNLVAVAANTGIFLWLFRDRLSRRLPAALPGRSDVPVASWGFFRRSLAVGVAVLAGLFGAGLANYPLWPVALVGGGVLAYVALGVGRRSVQALASGISWSLFPFVVGMAAIVRGVEHAGLTAGLGRLILGYAGTPGGAVAVTGGIAALGANIFNNIPMALVMLTVLAAVPHARLELLAAAALAGVNIGPALTTVGSLATMLWLAFTRRQGMEVSATEYLRTSVVTVPLVLAATLAAIALGALYR